MPLLLQEVGPCPLQLYPKAPLLGAAAQSSAGMLVTVSAELPIDAATYLLERDGAAFRSFIAEVRQGGSKGLVQGHARGAQHPCSPAAWQCNRGPAFLSSLCAGDEPA